MIFLHNRVNFEKYLYVQENQPLLLVAYHQKRVVGFKLGYVIPGRNVFFSWLGGVRKGYRRQGIASDLLILQEETVRSNGCDSIYFTSFNRYPEMIALGKKYDYSLVKAELDEGEMKYWYEKSFV